MIKVVAVVVTFNRKNLLIEALNSLLAQTYPLEKIILINNASTDNTEQLLIEKGFLAHSLIDYRLLSSNVGGAGGFHEGLKVAGGMTVDWVWVMDDDSIPELNALEALLSANQRLRHHQLNPLILASRVNWIDGSPHPMNFPQLKRKDWTAIYAGLAEGCFPLRSTSFVSMLMNAKCIEEYGLPIASYFIWNDDTEYTGRILRNGEGYLVSSSVVVHKTTEKYTAFTKAGDRFYYEVRNKLWMIRFSSAWTGMERVRYILILFKNIFDYLSEDGYLWKKIKIVLRGFLHGLFKYKKL